jgi:hypothetical protein
MTFPLHINPTFWNATASVSTFADACTAGDAAAMSANGPALVRFAP